MPLALSYWGGWVFSYTVAVCLPWMCVPYGSENALDRIGVGADIHRHTWEVLKGGGGTRSTGETHTATGI
jgi:hypothetical protein